MKTKYLFFLAAVLSAVLENTPAVFAQEAAKEVPAAPAAEIPQQPVFGGGGMPAGFGAGMQQMPRMNPAVLMRMRDQMTFELQQTQRQLNFIDPADTQLRDSFTERQNELVKQIKDINEQLKAATALPEGMTHPAAANGLPERRQLPNAEIPDTLPNPLPMGQQNLPPNLPKHFDPVMFSGGNPAMPAVLPPAPQSTPPAAFDQEQAFANSPWIPQPSKELTELKKSVESLRKETEELKTSIKALEAQIQLLNRNILLSQPAASK
ncbi:hypothetical protein FACS189427_12540 [Planctomycetales bacterium]|nr:hypothetical protein FACS189427_12540 [Planctomycetales bacterium]